MTKTKIKTAAATPTTTRRCAIYTRKSTSVGLEQDFNSLDAQREACEAYIRSQAHAGWRVTEPYSDGGFSGATLERPAFQKLLADLDAGKVDVVVVHRVDRLSRSLHDFARLMRMFEEKGVGFVSVTQSFDTSSSMGRLTLNMLMSFAEFEREMISERTRSKLEASRRRGKWTGGSLPYGYSAVDKKLVINGEEAVVVREIFDLYLELRSPFAVMRELHARKRTMRRQRSSKDAPLEERDWTKKEILGALHRPVYAGLLRVGDELFVGEHEAIISRGTYDQAQAILSGAAKRSTVVGRNPEYILRGVLRCRCGRSLTPGSSSSKSGRYRYYRCATRDKHGTPSCAAVALPAEAIEKYVVDRLREVAADGRLASGVLAGVEAGMASQRESLNDERERLPRIIASLKSEGQRVVDAIVDAPVGDRRLFDDRLQNVSSEIARHEARLAKVDLELKNLEVLEADGGWLAKCLHNFDSAWELMSLENRGRLVRAIVREVVVDEKNNRVTATLVDLGSSSASDPAPAPVRDLAPASPPEIAP